jgi:uncharacterized protein
MQMGTRSRQIPTVVQTGARALPAAVGLIALLLVGPRPVDAYVNWLWFGVVGSRTVRLTVPLTG